jgi:hypothetical protein
MIAMRGFTAYRFIFITLIATVLTVHSTACLAVVVVTTDPSVAAAFQAWATVENFDDLSALAITSYAAGQSVPAGNQFSSRDLAAFTAPFFNSGGASFNDPVGNPGTPIGIFDPGGAISTDTASANNAAGPLVVGSDEAFNNGFLEVIFPTDMQRVGLWVTHGTFTMFLKDATNTNLATGDVMVTGSQGEFIGITRDTADIRGVTMGFPESFTFDDFTYATSAIPEPASMLLAVLGLGVFLLRRRAG